METDLTYWGTSGQNAGVWLLKSNQPERIYEVQAGYSPYGLDYSEHHKLLAVGFANSSSGNKLGKVVLMKLDDQGGFAQLKADKQVPGSVLNVSFVKDYKVACGTTNGKVRIWDLNDINSQPIEIIAHNGYVLSLAETASGTLLSLGSDCILKEWNIDSGVLIKEYQANGVKPISFFFQAICEAGDLGKIITQFPNGSLCCVYDSEKEEEKIQVTQKCSSAAFFPNEYVVLNQSGTLLKLCDITSNSISEESDCPPSIGVKALTTQTFALIKKDKTAEIWSIYPLEKIKAIPLEEVRGISGFKRQLFIKENSSKIEQRRKELMEESVEILESPDFEKINRHVIELEKVGLLLESYILFADWCTRYNKPLWELQARLNICSNLKQNSPVEAVHFVALAKLYEKLNEPELALHSWKQADKRDKDIEGLAESIHRLETITSFRKKQQNIVLDYFNGTASLIEEKQKYDALNKSWELPFALRLKAESLKGITTSEDCELLKQYLCKKDFSKKEICYFFADLNWQNVSIIEYKQHYHTEKFKIQIAFHETSGQYEAYYRAVFSPDKQSVSEKNWQEMAAVLHSQESEHFRKWLENVTNKVAQYCTFVIKRKNKSGTKF